MSKMEYKDAKGKFLGHDGYHIDSDDYSTTSTGLYLNGVCVAIVVQEGYESNALEKRCDDICSAWNEKYVA